MICTKCGNMLAEDALFCTRCGEKVEESVSSEEENGKDAEKKFNVVLADAGNEKVHIIRLVMTWTGMSIKDSKELVEKAPIVLKRNVIQEEAERIKSDFEKEGAKVVFIDKTEAADVAAAIDCAAESKSDAVTIPANDPPTEKEPSKLEKFWDNCPTAGKVLLVVGTIIALIAFLWKFWPLIFFLIFIAVLIFPIFTGTREEKLDAWKTIVEMVGCIIIIAIIVAVVVLKPNFIVDIFQPGASVRNAYLSQYSEKVTVEEAFDHFFDSGKWDTYKEGGYSYVVFTGSCEYFGKRADARITFKITGENFVVDTLDVNGSRQSDFVLYALMAAVYEEY